MKIDTLVVGQLGTNCYLVSSKNEVGIIDPGDDADFMIRQIQTSGDVPVWIACTHGHFDHVLAVTELALAFNIPFYIHPADKFLLKRAKETGEHFLGVYQDPILVKSIDLKKGMKLKMSDESLEVIETPGHTPGSVCLYSKSNKVLFGGDLIFAEGFVGRTDFKYSSAADLEVSIKKVLKLPGDTIIYPGHNEQISISSHKKTRT